MLVPSFFQFVRRCIAEAAHSLQGRGLAGVALKMEVKTLRECLGKCMKVKDKNGV